MVVEIQCVGEGVLLLLRGEGRLVIGAWFGLVGERVHFWVITPLLSSL